MDDQNNILALSNAEIVMQLGKRLKEYRHEQFFGVAPGSRLSGSRRRTSAGNTCFRKEKKLSCFQEKHSISKACMK